MKSCKTCDHSIVAIRINGTDYHECQADYPCVDESWHSWKAKDMSRQIADDADHARQLKKDVEPT